MNNITYMVSYLKHDDSISTRQFTINDTGDEDKNMQSLNDEIKLRDNQFKKALKVNIFQIRADY